jgi:hypothetical protein
MKIQAFHQIESTLSDNGVRLVFIGNSTPNQTKEFLEITTVHVCGDLYSDPQLGLYKLFDLKRGRIRSLLMPLVSGISKYGMKGVKEGNYLQTSNHTILEDHPRLTRSHEQNYY